MFVRLSVVTPPKTPALAALRQVRAAAREAADRPGIDSARGSHVRRVLPDTRFAFTLARVGVMLWSDERTALDEEMAAVDGALAREAHEGWDVSLQVACVHGAWPGFSPQPRAVAPLDPNEPAVVFIHGVLKARYRVPQRRREGGATTHYG